MWLGPLFTKYRTFTLECLPFGLKCLLVSLKKWRESDQGWPRKEIGPGGAREVPQNRLQTKGATAGINQATNSKMGANIWNFAVCLVICSISFFIILGYVQIYVSVIFGFILASFKYVVWPSLGLFLKLADLCHWTPRLMGASFSRFSHLAFL